MRRLITRWLCCCLILVIAACGNQEPSKPNLEEPSIGSEEASYVNAYEKEAMVIYTKQCISCHATDLSGLVGEQTNLQEIGARLTKEEIANVIRNGGQIMPAQIKLTDEEVELMANWLALKK